MNIANKDIRIFGDTGKVSPIVYLHTFRHEGEEVWKQCTKISTKRFILVEIDGVDWNNDMSPWPCAKLFDEDTACKGGGEEWLQMLTSQIIPAAEKDLTVSRRYIAGYSLAGLFALWAVYHTDVFDGVISGSGSFWYPGFVEYAASHHLMRQPSSIYLSLGDRESRVRNRTLQCVEENTRWLSAHYQAQGITTTFELNTGNHYMQTELRMAKGIGWTLRQ
jgi:predicted alpha/beta superfamily hydrolase